MIVDQQGEGSYPRVHGLDQLAHSFDGRVLLGYDPLQVFRRLNSI
jgi:hypothetical protein